MTVGFLSFFFLYLLRLLNIIDKPFKVGRERTDDDVSLFLLSEFIVHAEVAAQGRTVDADELADLAEDLEDALTDAETSADAVSADSLDQVIDDQDLGERPT